MPHVLRMTDGTTTINLTTTGVLLRHYVPQEAKRVVGTIADYEDVAEPIELLLEGSGGSTTAMQTLHSQIKAMLYAAELRAETGRGPRVYIQYQPSNDPINWRSELRGGAVDLADNAMTVYGQAKMAIRLTITRSGVWEAASEIELPLASVTSTSPATGGKPIQNHYVASTAGNFVTIAHTAVGGVIPTPPRIVLQNASGGTLVFRNIYLGCEQYANGATNYCNMVQGEADQAPSPGSDVSNPAASGGTMLEIEFTGQSSPRWHYSVAAVRAAAGRTFRLLVRFNFYSLVPGNVVWVQPALNELSGAFDLNPYVPRRALEALSVVQLVDVGTVSFGDYPLSAGMATVLRLFSQAEVTVDIDYIQPLPADNFRRLEYVGVGVPNNHHIIDDGIEGRAYQVDGSSQEIPVVSPKGNPILLYPGKVNRLYVLSDLGATAPIDNDLNARVYYRPRRLTVGG